MRLWLMDIRESKCLSKKVLAESVGISQAYYCYIENGERRPSVDTAKKIAKILDFDWTKFFEDDTGYKPRHIQLIIDEAIQWHDLM